MRGVARIDPAARIGHSQVSLLVSLDRLDRLPVASSVDIERQQRNRHLGIEHRLDGHDVGKKVPPAASDGILDWRSKCHLVLPCKARAVLVADLYGARFTTIF